MRDFTYVFLVDRLNYLKFMGPLIRSLRAGSMAEKVKVVALQAGESAGYKSAYAKEIDRLADHIPNGTDLIFLKSREEVAKWIKKERIVSVFSLHSRKAYGVREGDISGPWVILQHYADNLGEAASIFDADLFAAYAKPWFESVAGQLPTSLDFLGFPQLDDLIYLDKSGLKKQFGFDPQKPLVTYLSFDHPYSYSFGPRWKQLLFRCAFMPDLQGIWASSLRFFFGRMIITEESLVKGLSAYCRANGAGLVIKSRAKRPIPESIARYCDKVIYDESYSPGTMLQLFKASDLVVNSLSIGTCESVCAGAYTVGVFPGWLKDYFLAFPNSVFPDSWKDFFSMPGACEISSIGNFLRTLEGGVSIESRFSLDPVVQKRYVSRFLGPQDGRITERLLKKVSAIAARKGSE